MLVVEISGLLIVVGYLFGSIPTGYLLAKWLKGIDIREHGSGSTGATNILRTVGKTAALTVLIVDLLKGAAAVAVVKASFGWFPTLMLPLEPWQAWLVMLSGIAAIFGHSKSIWLGFSGGKSVAASLGVLLMMSPPVALGTIAAFILTLVFFRIVSLGSISGAIAVNLFMILLHQPIPYCLFAAFAGTYVILRHRTNIQRILAGTEPAIGQKLKSEVKTP